MNKCRILGLVFMYGVVFLYLNNFVVCRILLNLIWLCEDIGGLYELVM